MRNRVKVRRYIHRAMLSIAACMMLAAAHDVHAQSPTLAPSKDDKLLAPFQFGGGEDNKLPFLLEADQTRYERETDTVLAEGSVRISREGRILTADRVEYRISKKIVVAIGNVVLIELTGEVLFAEEIELTETLDQGIAIAPRILLPDGSRIAAAGTSRISKDKVEVRRAVFSPCSLCPSHPDRAPLWQLRANKITHSEARQEIEMEGATLDIFGVPVAYLPYFSQPDPRVKKKTGFLVPKVSQDDNLGVTAEIPFFWNLSPNRDVTLTPHLFTSTLPILVGNYRHLFPFGKAEIEASGGIVERTQNGITTNGNARGHIRINGEASLDDHWRSSFQLYRAADDTYLRTFNLDETGVLRSFATLEGFYRRLYVNATTFDVQEQRQNFDDDATPTALPFVTADYTAPLGFGGINLTGQAAGHVLFRTDGGDTQHATLRLGLNRHWNLGGNLISADVEMRGDLFQSSESTSGTDGVGGRFLPRATVDWSYPVFRPVGSGTLTLTPRVMGTITTRGLNTAELPNEDSQSLEFDSTALFRPALADGRDRFDDGERIDYGVEGVLDFSAIRLTGLVGQSFRNNSSRSFGNGTGLTESTSDIVMGFGVEASNWLNGYNRLRWDTNDGSISASETGIHLTKGRVQAVVQHSFLKSRTFDGLTLAETNQIEGALQLQLTDHWSIVGRHRFDLDAGEYLRTQVGFSYGDECLSLQVLGTIDETSTSEVGTNKSISLRLALRHLGATGKRKSLLPQ
jgi:LPS-assembly protein